MAPLELVMLEFATMQVNTGTVIFQAFSESILIDLTSKSQIAVSFHINTGWDANGSPYAQYYPAGTSIAPLLIME